MAELVRTVPAVALAVYAHPDDPDVAAGGALAAWAAAGCEVHVCIAADGAKGSSDPAADPAELARRRRGEVAEAGALLGVAAHHWLDGHDGELEDTPALRGAVVAVVRAVKPDVVVGADPTAVFFGQSYVNHRDHRTLGWLTIDAVSPAAANPHYFPEAGAAHRVSALYLSGTLEPDVWVDIGDTVDVKAA
ncbi:MAG: PIG-L deacetylase family protein, partial [Acidimicrobiales bacterium]